ncbi:MAG: glycosyltransferase family 39 protein [Verrucomicrobiota bacterium]
MLSLEAKQDRKSVLDHFTIARCCMIVVFSGLVWRLLRYFWNFDLSGDESNIMNNVLARTYGELLHPLDYSQVSPPAFLWATKLFDVLFRNEWGVRLLPLLAGLGGMAVFWELCVQVLRGVARWVAWAIFSVSYVPVAEGACVKGYTIDLLAAMLLLWLMLRWLHGGQRARELAWLALCAPVMVWFSYTSAFVIGAISLVFMAHCFMDRGRTDWRNLLAGILFMALTACSATGLYEANIRSSLDVSQASGLQAFWHLGYPPMNHPWLIPFWLLDVHTGRGFAWPLGENHFGSTLTTALWLTGLVMYWRRGNRWVWALFVVPHVLLLIAAFLHKYPYGANPRICMFLGPGICLFMGAAVQWLLGRLGGGRRRLCYRVGALLLLFISLGGVTRDGVLRFREINGPDLRSTLVAAGRIAGTGSQFVVLPGETSQILAYYMKRYVTQTIWRRGEISPSQVRPGSNLVVLATTTKPGGLDSDSFEGFEEQFGTPMTLIWTQVARVQPAAKEPGVVVRVYKLGSQSSSIALNQSWEKLPRSKMLRNAAR